MELPQNYLKVGNGENERAKEESERGRESIRYNLILLPKARKVGVKLCRAPRDATHLFCGVQRSSLQEASSRSTLFPSSSEKSGAKTR